MRCRSLAAPHVVTWRCHCCIIFTELEFEGEFAVMCLSGERECKCALRYILFWNPEQFSQYCVCDVVDASLTI